LADNLGLLSLLWYFYHAFNVLFADLFRAAMTIATIAGVIAAMIAAPLLPDAMTGLMFDDMLFLLNPYPTIVFALDFRLQLLKFLGSFSQF
jgi:hypothetical protein